MPPSDRYRLRAVAEPGQVIDGFLSKEGDPEDATGLSAHAAHAHGVPDGVTTDRTAVPARATTEFRQRALHDTTR
jgi:transposase-like protein